MSPSSPHILSYTSACNVNSKQPNAQNSIACHIAHYTWRVVYRFQSTMRGCSAPSQILDSRQSTGPGDTPPGQPKGAQSGPACCGAHHLEAGRNLLDVVLMFWADARRILYSVHSPKTALPHLYHHNFDHENNGRRLGTIFLFQQKAQECVARSSPELF